MQSSRVLNDRKAFFGLNLTDISVLGGSLIAIEPFLGLFGLEAFTLIMPVVAAVVLSPIRIGYRRKIIRDYLAFTFLPKKLEEL